MTNLSTASAPHVKSDNLRSVNLFFGQTQFHDLSKMLLIAIGMMIGLLHGVDAQAQYIRDNTYFDGCRQNIANPAAGWECKRIDPDDTPYKNEWSGSINVNSQVVILTDKNREKVRDLFIDAANAEQERLEAAWRAAGYNYVGYPYRYIINPNKSTCSEPRVDTSWTYAPDYSRRGVGSYCYAWQIDSRYSSTAPQYFVNEVTINIGKIAVCENGWNVNGAGPPDFYGSYTKYPHICYKQETSKELGSKCTGSCGKCTSCGNPINFGTGNKYQVETDYVGTGPMPLRIERTYNSATPTDNFDSILAPGPQSFGRNWRFNYDRRLQPEGFNTVRITRPDGKVLYFHLIGGSWKPDSDISDQLTSNTNGYSYFNSATLEVESFDGAGRMTSIADQSGNVTTLQYINGTLLSVTDPFGRTLTIAYSNEIQPKIISITDPQGGIYAYGYPGNRVGQVTFPDGTSRQYLYGETAYAASSSQNLLTGIVNENNIRLSTYRYDATGRAYSTEWAGGVNKFTATANSQIDPLGRTKTYNLTNINGVKAFYDVVHPCAATGCTGTTTEIFRHDTNGNLTTYFDLRGISTVRTFDTVRNLELSRTEANNALPRTTTTTWHPIFRLPSTTTEPVRVGGVNGVKTTSFGYDGVGNLTQKIVATPSGVRTWIWSYNANGQVLTAVDPLGRTTVNTYYPNSVAQGTSVANSSGMLATSTNSLGQTTRVTDYNAHGQPTAVVDPNGLVTEFAYDLRKRLVTRTAENQITRYQYDGVGQLTRVTLPDSSYVAYFYDDAQRLVRIQDGLGNYIRYTLDNAGNRTSENAYDKMGALTRSRTRVFDDLGRMLRDIGGASPASQVTASSNGICV